MCRCQRQGSRRPGPAAEQPRRLPAEERRLQRLRGRLPQEPAAAARRRQDAAAPGRRLRSSRALPARGRQLPCRAAAARWPHGSVRGPQPLLARSGRHTVCPGQRRVRGAQGQGQCLRQAGPARARPRLLQPVRGPPARRPGRPEQPRPLPPAPAGVRGSRRGRLPGPFRPARQPQGPLPPRPGLRPPAAAGPRPRRPPGPPRHRANQRPGPRRTQGRRGPHANWRLSDPSCQANPGRHEHSGDQACCRSNSNKDSITCECQACAYTCTGTHTGTPTSHHHSHHSHHNHLNHFQAAQQRRVCERVQGAGWRPGQAGPAAAERGGRAAAQALWQPARGRLHSAGGARRRRVYAARQRKGVPGGPAQDPALRHGRHVPLGAGREGAAADRGAPCVSRDVGVGRRFCVFRSVSCKSFLKSFIILSSDERERRFSKGFFIVNMLLK
eukprot:m.96920 g.96920  ORF g.96920 m.96920 type:complete len:442 (+) comp15505_c0_seq1:206-1531(+)